MRPALQGIPDNLAAAPGQEIALAPNCDVFISHVSEDKIDIVRPLAEALRGHDLDVGYDEFELKIGDSLRRKIDSGIAKSNQTTGPSS